MGDVTIADGHIVFELGKYVPAFMQVFLVAGPPDGCHGNPQCNGDT